MKYVNIIIISFIFVFISISNVYASVSIDDYYTIFLNSNGGVVSPYLLKIKVGDSIGNLPIPNDFSDMVFEGWYTEINSGIKVDDDYIPKNDMILYAHWNSFPIVFSQIGECNFNGIKGVITGEECLNYIGRKYIDTNIELYSNDNINKDYEIGFTIESYSPSLQDSGISQQTFMNTKLEGSNYPGLVFRRAGNNLEIQSRRTKTSNSGYVNYYSYFKVVKIYRIDNKIYYSINNNEKTLLNDLDIFNPTFNLSVWFGATPTNELSVSAHRFLKGTLSNMYIKLGKYNE